MTSTRALPRRPALRPPKPVPEVVPPPLGVRFGVEANKSCAPIGFDPEAGQHLLISGAPGSGKSGVLRSLLQGSLDAGFNAYLAASAVDECAFEGLSAAGTGLSGAHRVLSAAVTEMERRQERLIEQNKRHYSRLHPPATPVLVIVDDILELLRLDLNIGSRANLQRAAVGSMLDAIAQHGPKNGLSLLITSRVPAGSLIAGRLFPHLHELTETAAQLVLESHSKPGRGVWTPVDGDQVQVQAEFIPAQPAQLQPAG